MATGNLATWQNVQSKLMAMGYAVSATIGEPRSGVQSRMVALIPMSGEVDETVLNAPREMHRLGLRMYMNILEEPVEDVEVTLDQFRADILEDVFGEFDLGGTIAYPFPTETAWEYDEKVVGNTTYRTIEIVIAYRVDDRATFAA